MAKSPTATRKAKGQGGRRKGFAAPNEIEDMRLFDEVPGKQASQENGSPPAELEDEFEAGPLVGGRHGPAVTGPRSGEEPDQGGAHGR
jgi:hypothetical protein